MQKITDGANELERLIRTNPMDFLGRSPIAQRITEEEYANHDCKVSDEDGCDVCVAWANQKAAESRMVDASMTRAGFTL